MRFLRPPAHLIGSSHRIALLKQVVVVAVAPPPPRGPQSDSAGAGAIQIIWPAGGSILLMSPEPGRSFCSASSLAGAGRLGSCGPASYCRSRAAAADADRAISRPATCGGGHKRLSDRKSAAQLGSGPALGQCSSPANPVAIQMPLAARPEVVDAGPTPRRPQRQTWSAAADDDGPEEVCQQARK